MLVNENFEKLLYEIFGEEIIKKFKQEHAAVWIQMVNQYEIMKRSIDPYNPNPSVTDITLHPRFVRFYEKKIGADIDTVFTQELESKGIRGNEGQLQLSLDAMMALYKPATNAIVAYVENLLQKPQLKVVTHMLIVGGFGECRVLQDAIKMHFCNNFKIMVPQEASQCVLRGAVKFGYPPDPFVARRACKIYGYNTDEKFDPALHDPNKTRMIEGTKYAHGLFNVFVRKNERVEAGDQKTVTLYPLTKDQSALAVGLYSTDNEPKYVDEDGVVKEGEVRISLPGTGRDREVEVLFAFGYTEIDVQLRDPRDGGDMAGTKIDFLVG